MTTSPLAATSDPTNLRTRVAVPLSARKHDDDDEPRLLPTDDEDVPRETLDVLGQARDALLLLVRGLFEAAEAIVTALLRLVQTVAGREAAETVDRSVADVLDPIVPRVPAQTGGPSAPTGRSTDPPVDGDAAPTGPAERDADDLQAGVRDVLLAHAGTEAERDAVSPSFVGMVATGVQFVLSVERQFPGAVDALLSGTTPTAADELGTSDAASGAVSLVEEGALEEAPPAEEAAAPPADEAFVVC